MVASMEIIFQKCASVRPLISIQNVDQFFFHHESLGHWGEISVIQDRVQNWMVQVNLCSMTRSNSQGLFQLSHSHEMFRFPSPDQPIFSEK